MDFLAANQALAAVQWRAVLLESFLVNADDEERAGIHAAIAANARAEAFLRTLVLPDPELAKGDHYAYPVPS